LAGVPLKVPVAASKRSQPGRAEPSARLAARLSCRRRPGRRKAPDGTREGEGGVLGWRPGRQWARPLQGIVGVGHGQAEAALRGEPRGVGGGDDDLQGADVGIGRRAAEGAGGAVELKPRGQCVASSASVAVKVSVSPYGGVCALNALGRNGEGEGLIFGGSLVGNGAGQRRRVVGVATPSA
jgi:hypothetical protein